MLELGGAADQDRKWSDVHGGTSQSPRAFLCALLWRQQFWMETIPQANGWLFCDMVITAQLSLTSKACPAKAVVLNAKSPNDPASERGVARLPAN